MKFDLNLGEVKLGEATVNNINMSVECSLTEMVGYYDLLKQSIKDAPELFENLRAIEEDCNKFNDETVECIRVSK